MYDNKIYLFVHAIWSVKHGSALLTNPIRKLMLAHIVQEAESKGTKILVINGVEDHVHCLLQLTSIQNVATVLKGIKSESSHWLNENKLLAAAFEWHDGYAAYSVSPSGVKQVTDYIHKQEEHHKTKTLESELGMFDKIQF